MRQPITLEAPSEITNISVKKGKALIQEINNQNARMLKLGAGQEVELEIRLK